jgi:hypothetical protein
MLFPFLRGLFGGKPKGVFVIGRKKKADDPNEPLKFFVRPGVIVVEDDQVRFRNLTKFRIQVINADFLKEKSFYLEPRKQAGDHKKFDLADDSAGNFFEYDVLVYEDPNAPAEAIGDSRPGAIIDR